ncbi:MAG: AbrB/MazE/SpoVT family DNA-binding domain-containing protein [Pyrinomonadaceae bacterium]
MSMIRSRITAQGQISVPAAIRRKLGLGPGSVIEWEEHGDEVLVRRAGRYSSEDIHNVLFKEPPKPIKLDEMKEAIRTHIRKKYARR